jgi:hypothetical protein
LVPRVKTTPSETAEFKKSLHQKNQVDRGVPSETASVERCSFRKRRIQKEVSRLKLPQLDRDVPTPSWGPGPVIAAPALPSDTSVPGDSQLLSENAWLTTQKWNRSNHRTH